MGPTYVYMVCPTEYVGPILSDGPFRGPILSDGPFRGLILLAGPFG
jgi:hypothetical protein